MGVSWLLGAVPREEGQGRHACRCSAIRRPASPLCCALFHSRPQDGRCGAVKGGDRGAAHHAADPGGRRHCPPLHDPGMCRGVVDSVATWPLTGPDAERGLIAAAAAAAALCWFRRVASLSPMLPLQRRHRRRCRCRRVCCAEVWAARCSAWLSVAQRGSAWFIVPAGEAAGLLPGVPRHRAGPGLPGGASLHELRGLLLPGCAFCPLLSLLLACPFLLPGWALLLAAPFLGGPPAALGGRHGRALPLAAAVTILCALSGRAPSCALAAALPCCALPPVGMPFPGSFARQPCFLQAPAGRGKRRESAWPPVPGSGLGATGRARALPMPLKLLLSGGRLLQSTTRTGSQT